MIYYKGHSFEIDYLFRIIESCNLFTSDKNNLFGLKILEELTKKVFYPPRLLNISSQYDIEFIDLIDVY